MFQKLRKPTRVPVTLIISLILLSCIDASAAGKAFENPSRPIGKQFSCTLALPLHATKLASINWTKTNFGQPTLKPALLSLLSRPTDVLIEPVVNQINNITISTNEIVETPPVVAPLEPLLPSITSLDAELQWQIYTDVCHKDQVRFCILMAMGRKESGFDPSKIGDNGKSYGVVQVMVKWHIDRLAKFGYTPEDLFDPVKCFTVGLDYLEELAGRPEELEVTHLLLMKYNMGPSGAAEAVRKGHSSSYYSREVIPYFEEYLAEFNLPA